MTPACAGCGAALSATHRRTCAVCGLRVGDLRSNVDELRAQERTPHTQPRAGVAPRALLLVLVLGVMLAFAFAAGADAAQPGVQPALSAAGRVGVSMLQAAEGAIGRRSRTPGPGNPDSAQWKQAGGAQVAVVAVVAGGLILFVRTRLR